MISNQTQARDEILSRFKATWEGNEVSELLPVLYDDISQQIPGSGAWCRITVDFVGGFKTSLGNTDGEARYTKTGVVTVQVFTESLDGQVLADQLAFIVEGAFEGVVTTPGRVIFRNVRTVSVGRSGQWLQTNVLADFEYDTVR